MFLQIPGWGYIDRFFRFPVIEALIGVSSGIRRWTGGTGFVDHFDKMVHEPRPPVHRMK